MSEPTDSPRRHVFISYASEDRERVLPIVAALEHAGIKMWLDQTGIAGGANYGTEIVSAIRQSAALLAMCSAAAFASRNVRQEVALAWKHGRVLLPLRLDPIDAPDELAYWLEAAQWVDVLDRRETVWLPELLKALERHGIVPLAPSLPPLGRGTTLPVPMTELLGREREVAEVAELLNVHRLITLVGPGGVGKTRLALAAAARVAENFAEGALFVDLTAIRDPNLLPSAIGHAFGLREGGDRSLTEQLIEFLRHRELLILLDNVEQVVEASPFLADLLVECPRLSVLATSRVWLNLSLEHLYLVSPLDLPDHDKATVTDARDAAAVRLFVQRATAVKPNFVLDDGNSSAVVEIVRRLDGLPLAIELAAARLALFPPAALAARLERRLPLLTTGPRDHPARHQTLRDAIAWSYDLLTPEEQWSFRQLAVFVGGFTIDEAEAVIAARGVLGNDAISSITSLVANSLVQQMVGTDGDGRLAILETIREFGLEQLEASGEATPARDGHVDYYFALAERAAPHLHGADQVRWWMRLEAEHANLRAAFAWLEQTGRTEQALRFTAALMWYYIYCGHLREGQDWLERALAMAGSAPTETRVLALAAAGGLAGFQGNVEQNEAFGARALELAQAAGLNLGIGISEFVLLFAATMEGDLDRAVDLGEDAIARFRAEEVSHWLGFTLCDTAFAARLCGDTAHGMTLSHEGLAIHRTLGNRWGQAVHLSDLGLIAHQAGDLALAAQQYLSSVRLLADIGASWYLANPLAGLANIAVQRHRPDTAARLLGAASTIHERSGSTVFQTERERDAQTLEAARLDLGDESLERAMAEGRMLAIDAVIALAEASAIDINEEYLHQARTNVARQESDQSST